MIPAEQALANASPLSVRRIQNRIGVRDKETALKRYSAAHAESFGSVPKLVNQVGGSGTLPPSASGRGYLHASDSNISNTSPSALLDSEEARKRPVRHNYEDVEKRSARHNYEDVEIKNEASAEGSKSDSRTMNWVNHHTELNWGRGDDPREMTGSIWSTRNRVQRQHSKEKLRNGSGTRRLSKSKSDQGRELLSTFQGPSPPRVYRQPTVSAVPQPYPQAGSRQEERPPQLMERAPPPPQLMERGVAHRPHAEADRPLLKSRRVSYVHAMNDPSELPVRENPTSLLRPTREEELASHHGHRASRDEQFTSPEYTPGAYTSNHHGNSRHLEGYGSAQASHLYQPRPLSTHGMHRQDSYGSLQRDMTASVNPSHGRRRGSESSEPPLVGGGRGAQYFHANRSHLQGIHPHRTFSNERTYSNNSPPQREHAHTDHTLRSTPPHPHRSAQVESYL